MDKFVVWFQQLLGSIKALSDGLVAERLASERFEDVKEGEEVLLTLNPDLARFTVFLDIQSDAIGVEEKKGEEDLRRMIREGRPMPEVKAFHKKLEEDLARKVNDFTDLARLFWIAVREEHPGTSGDDLRVAKGGLLVKTLPEEKKGPKVSVTLIEVPVGGLDHFFDGLDRD